MDWDILSILLPAFTGGMLILSTHLILGRQVLRRGIVFMDLAIAQVAALGALSGHLLQIESGLAGVLLPYAFSLAGAGLIASLSHRIEQELEAVIGCLYVTTAAGFILLLSNDPHGAEHISNALAGHILWLNWSDLIAPGLLTLVLLILMTLRPRLLQGRGFYLLFAIAVTASVKLIGVYLVFSTLIMPALSVSRLTGRKALGWGYFSGITGYIVGLIASGLYDFPGGAAVVVALFFVCLSFRLLLNAKGSDNKVHNETPHTQQ